MFADIQAPDPIMWKDFSEYGLKKEDQIVLKDGSDRGLVIAVIWLLKFIQIYFSCIILINILIATVSELYEALIDEKIEEKY